MNVKVFQFNPVGVNTYVVYDETKECTIIDAGCFYADEKEHLLNFILDNDLIVKHMINTHLHFDHVFGCNFISEQFGVVLEANDKDQFLLDQFDGQLRMFGFNPVGEAPKIGKVIKEGDMIEFGDQRFFVIHVPGHSPGSLVFYNEEEECLFAGDVLFRDSIGRTDLARGNHDELVAGIKSKLMTLPPETLVYSGHGPNTTVGYEKKHNPYLQ
ncbi:MBL fold metallo-hydrolase [Dysgonomonas sp. 520]|uniref:MBL fold metallo-hydrolase n=1 Tax=Dysgonomonas sp. 520 TaxID=2302931 RepID=UPI0013D7021C|nr:MBL fold metallo-hydrolase [Dysgonomonas sp. 520]NDW10312.1 MBL fold metallo-hydrolase [Dysgonomonas sp. 520]